MPAMLRDKQGKYQGQVYVLGRITDVVVPCSEEDRAIGSRISSMGSGIPTEWRTSFCRVQFDRLGRKESLSAETQGYLNKVCRNTFSKLCDRSSKKIDTEKADRMKFDLWKNAIYRIDPDSLDDADFFLKQGM